MASIARRPAMVAALAVVALTAGCGGSAGGGSDDPQWVAKPELPPARVDPGLPGGPAPGPPGAPSPGEPGPGQSGEGSGILATNLALPWGIEMMPDGSAIVGERTTGRIVRVKPQPAPVDEVMRIGGLDASGTGGLLGLALSPTYLEDRLVFAYVTTPTDNRILRFELGGTPQPIFTGIPRGPTGNGGRIVFGPDGNLFVGTGDAGRPELAAQPTSLAGKVLRLTPFGEPAEDNPTPGSPVYATGFRDITGLCFGQQGQLYAADVGNSQVDEVNLVEEGENYGWPRASGETITPQHEEPLVNLPAAETNPGGCGVIGFGLFVAALDGTKLWAVPLTGSDKVGTPVELVNGNYGRLRSVAPAPDGALWVTTSNRDGHGQPIPEDDRVIRLVPPPETTYSPAGY